MSKPKRHIDEIFELKRKIKEHEETIKKLYRKLNNQEKAEKKNPIKKVVEKPVASNDCPECDDGKVKSTDLGFRTILTCSECRYRKVIKKNG